MQRQPVALEAQQRLEREAQAAAALEQAVLAEVTIATTYASKDRLCTPVVRPASLPFAFMIPTAVTSPGIISVCRRLPSRAASAPPDGRSASGWLVLFFGTTASR